MPSVCPDLENSANYACAEALLKLASSRGMRHDKYERREADQYHVSSKLLMRPHAERKWEGRREAE